MRLYLHLFGVQRIVCGDLTFNIFMKKTCKICSREFISNYPSKLYCSNECYQKGQRNDRISRPGYFRIKEKRICPVCKQEFSAMRSDKIHCSKKCMWKTSNDRHPRTTSRRQSTFTAIKQTPLTQDQKEIIYGCIMGDSSLKERNSFHCMTLAHCERQLPYLLYKKKLLQPPFSDVSPWFRDGIFPSYSVSSVNHPQLTNMYGLFYRNKKKIITMKTLNLFTPTSLLFWYLDDGTLNYEKRAITISTNCFTIGEVQTIKKWFWHRWKIKSNLHLSQGTVRGETKSWPIMRISSSYTEKFLSLISTSLFFKELPECMVYKFKFKPRINKSYLSC